MLGCGPPRSRSRLSRLGLLYRDLGLAGRASLLVAGFAEASEPKLQL
jgi:hypothetical protein